MKPTVPGTTPNATECGVEFTVTYPSDRFHCTHPPYHQGPHYDVYKGYTWGYDDPAQDPVTQQLWDIRRAAETADARKQARRRRRRNLWGKR